MKKGEEMLNFDKILTNGIIDIALFAKKDEINSLSKVPIEYYTIYIHGTNTIIGRIDLRLDNIDNDEIYYLGNIGIFINELYQKKGYALMALTLLENVAKEYDIEEITLTCEPTNKKMQQLAESLNYDFINQEKIPQKTIAYLNGYRERILFKKDLRRNVRKKC